MFEIKNSKMRRVIQYSYREKSEKYGLPNMNFGPETNNIFTYDLKNGNHRSIENEFLLEKRLTFF